MNKATIWVLYSQQNQYDATDDMECFWCRKPTLAQLLTKIKELEPGGDDLLIGHIWRTGSGYASTSSIKFGGTTFTLSEVEEAS